jgi:signal transduction histidine kinase
MKNVHEVEGPLKERFIRRSFEFRSVFITFVWIALEAIHYTGIGLPMGSEIAQMELNMWALRVLCLVEIFLWLPYLALLRAFPGKDNLINLLAVLMDVVVLTGFIHSLGGIESSFLPSLYLLLILYASGLFTQRDILWILVACSAAYATLFWFEFFELVPGVIGNKGDLRPLHYLVRLALALCLIWVGGFISMQVVNVLGAKRTLVHLGTFFAGLSHELRTPLAIIVNEVALLRKQGPSPQLDIIQGQAERVSNLFDQTLTYIEDQRLDLVPLDLRATVDKALGYVIKGLEEDRGRELEVLKGYSQDRVDVLGDDVQLQQAFINVIKNAIEAMDYRGRLRVTVGIYNVFWALVEISDTGAGMPRDVRARAFEPFFTTKRRGRGTGLGLPITRRIIEDHRGSLEVISQEGKGATFRFKIPMHD